MRYTWSASREVDKSTGLRSDQSILLVTAKSKLAYPDRLRRVSFRDPETDKYLVFLTNRFDLPALTIAQIYRKRWQVELFFKWIKQNLSIQHDPAFLRQFNQRRQVADLDRSVRLSARHDCSQAVGPTGIATDFAEHSRGQHV